MIQLFFDFLLAFPGEGVLLKIQGWQIRGAQQKLDLNICKEKDLVKRTYNPILWYSGLSSLSLLLLKFQWRVKGAMKLDQ